MSPIIDDLRIEAEIPPRPQRPGTPLTITLRFHNLGGRARTIYLITNEAYRFEQSTLHLHVSAQETVVLPPRSGAYVPTTGDFHQVPPRGTFESKQTLRLPGNIEPGKHAVEWVYENHVDHWPTSPNIPAAGQPIPGIWVGRLVDSFAITVARPFVDRVG